MAANNSYQQQIAHSLHWRPDATLHTPGIAVKNSGLADTGNSLETGPIYEK